MFGRIPVLPLATVALLAAGCSDDPVGIPDPAGPQFASASAEHVRPLKGSFEGHDVYGGYCHDGAGLELWTQASGTLTHFGRTLVEQYTCFDPYTFELFETSYTMTAANGDLVSGHVTGASFTAAGDLVMYFSIDAGTGRFENASGSFESTATSVGEPSEHRWVGPLSGEIYY